MERDWVKTDQGGVNARILAKQTKADFRRIEAASVKLPARFASPEGKRFFVRLFMTLQLNSHFISVIARTRLDHDDITQVETALRDQLEAVNSRLNEAIDEAEALFKAQAITEVASYDTVPLEVEVGVLSSNGRRYLEVLGKLDQLMPLLQTLEIHELLSPAVVDKQRALIKRQVRDVANAARRFATGLRRRMNLPPARQTTAAHPEGESLAATTESPVDEPTETKVYRTIEGFAGDTAEEPAP